MGFLLILSKPYKKNKHNPDKGIQSLIDVYTNRIIIIITMYGVRL